MIAPPVVRVLTLIAGLAIALAPAGASATARPGKEPRPWPAIPGPRTPDRGPRTAQAVTSCSPWSGTMVSCCHSPLSTDASGPRPGRSCSITSVPHHRASGQPGQRAARMVGRQGTARLAALAKEFRDLAPPDLVNARDDADRLDPASRLPHRPAAGAAPVPPVRVAIPEDRDRGRRRQRR